MGNNSDPSPEIEVASASPDLPLQPQTPTTPERPNRLPSPPFIHIDGLYNFRDCGGYPIASRPSRAVRRGILYRSGEPSRITAQGISQLQVLNISRIFDLRSDLEIERSTRQGWGQIRVWEQVTRIPAAVFTNDHITEGYQARRDDNLRNRGIEVGIRLYHTFLQSPSGYTYSADITAPRAS